MNRLWQIAEVIVDRSGRPALRLRPASACARCRAGNGCGAGVFSSLFGRKSLIVPAPPDWRLAPGQWLRVGVRADSLVWAAARIYGLPVMAFVAGAWLAEQWVAGSPATALVADLAALASGLLVGGAVFAWMLMWPTLRGLDPVFELATCAAIDEHDPDLESDRA